MLEGNNKAKIKIIKKRIENWKKGNYFVLWEQVIKYINEIENDCRKKTEKDTKIDTTKKEVFEKANKNNYINKKLTFFCTM